MKAIDCPFSKIVNGAMRFVIPVFQRDCSWTEAQWNPGNWPPQIHPLLEART